MFQSVRSTHPKVAIVPATARDLGRVARGLGFGQTPQVIRPAEQALVVSDLARHHRGI